MTYNVFGGTLSLTQSINQSIIIIIIIIIIMFTYQQTDRKQCVKTNNRLVFAQCFVR